MTHQPLSVGSFPQTWRSKRPPPGIYLEGKLLESAAFAELNRNEIRVVLRFYQKRQFPKKRKGQKVRNKVILNNGELTFPYSEALAMGISKSAFTRALDGVIRRGFIDIAYSGEGMYRSMSQYSISTRWMKYGTDQFVESKRRKRHRRVGFLNGHGKS